MAEGVPLWRRWHEPPIQAALVNGTLMMLLPAAFVVYNDYTAETVRPYAPSIARAVIRAVPVLIVCAPVAILVAWRSYVHALAYVQRRGAIWRGPLESAAIAGGLALAQMIVMTLATWAREPAPRVAAYIAFYAIAFAFIGLLLGIVLAGTAMLVLAGRRDLIVK